jgi:hypothetical protein
MNSPGRTSADSKPSWLGAGRYGVRPAPPGGLALVQDFLNTRAHAEKGPDLLGDAEHARVWAATAARNWSVLRGEHYPTLALTDAAAARLRELRDVLDMMLSGSRIKPPRWVGSAIMGEVVLSQETGTWRRMKQCRNPKCRATFYGSSWDNRGVCRPHPTTSARTPVKASVQLQQQTNLNKER